MHIIRRILLVAFCVAFFVALPRTVLFAQTAGEAVSSRKQQLEKDLAEIEKQINVQQQLLSAKQQENVSLARDVAILDAKIEKERLSIRARVIEIEKLSAGIADKQGVITLLSAKVEREKESLAQLIRKTDKIDSFSLPEVVLSEKRFSDFFADIDSFASIKKALHDSLTAIQDAKQSTEVEKSSLEDRRADEVSLRTIQELEKKRIEDQQREKQGILKTSRGVEKIYQVVLKEQEKSAAAIRAELFALRGSAAIPFGGALALAERAAGKLNLRPAFLLGIIAEESNLGENVGTGNWKIDMHPTRDQPVFADITSRLGLNPDAMPVSKKPWYGWGGAMGPAQFIPSTWILYEKRIAGLTGHGTPNPWNPEDAFMAAAILLADNGADRGGFNNERLAALRYLAGWNNAQKSAYAFYGDDVMELAAKYQRQIDILKGT